MQKLLIGILFATTIALAAVCVLQSRQLSSTRAQFRSADEARAAGAALRDAQSERMQDLERANAQLEQQVQKFATVTMQLRTNEARQASDLVALSERVRKSGQSGPGGAESGEGEFGAGMGQMLGTMMKDPAMREMMREQQKAAMNMLYGGLFKELKLSPEERDALKELLTDAQMKNIESAQSLFGGTNAGSYTDAGKSFAEAKKQTDLEVQALLGPERYATFEEYQKTMGERVQLDQLKTQLAGHDTPLQDQQTAQLLEIMKQEKAAVPPVIPTDNAQMPSPDLFTSENLDRQIQWMDDYNRRVLDRAGQVLTPQQLTHYRAFQEQQAAMQKLSLKMARQMFGGANSAPSPR
jgi:hypothetical protein